MERGFLSAINRPRGRLAARLKVDDPLRAYLASCVASTTIVEAILFAWSMLRLTLLNDWERFDGQMAIQRGLLTWTLSTFFGAVITAPFLLGATWMGARLEIESLPYYAGLGGGIMAAMVLLLVGIPAPTDFATSYLAWFIGPPCGTIGGGAWWYLHRRWKAVPPEGPQAPR